MLWVLRNAGQHRAFIRLNRQRQRLKLAGFLDSRAGWPGRSSNHPASHALAAAAKLGGMVRVVVAADMDHQGAALGVGHFEAGCQYRVAGLAHGIDKQCRQITQMPVAPGQTVAFG